MRRFYFFPLFATSTAMKIQTPSGKNAEIHWPLSCCTLDIHVIKKAYYIPLISSDINNHQKQNSSKLQNKQQPKNPTMAELASSLTSDSFALISWLMLANQLD